MNFRRILSKTSLRSSSSSGKILVHSGEVSQLHSEIESLKLTVESLKVSVESRDAAIGTLAREKEKLYVDLKSAQRTNRNLHQQLVDERDIHSKEKEYFNEEIQRLFKSEEKVDQDREEDELSNSLLKEELKTKDEVIYTICAKYLKIRHSKKLLQEKNEKLQLQSQETCQTITSLLRDNRYTMENLLKKIIRASTVSPSTRNYLKILRINANLHYENTQLKVCLSQKDLTEEVEDDHQSDKGYNQRRCSPTRITKSEGKLRNEVRGSTYHTRWCKVHNPNIGNFKNVHETFSPYYRRKNYRCCSDSYLQ